MTLSLGFSFFSDCEAKDHSVSVQQVETLQSVESRVINYPPSNKHGSETLPLGRLNSSMNRLYSTSTIVSGRVYTWWLVFTSKNESRRQVDFHLHVFEAAGRHQA